MSNAQVDDKSESKNMVNKSLKIPSIFCLYHMMIRQWNRNLTLAVLAANWENSDLPKNALTYVNDFLKPVN